MGHFLLESGSKILQENGTSLVLAEYPTNRITLESGYAILLEDKSSSLIEDHNPFLNNFIPVILLMKRAL